MTMAQRRPNKWERMPDEGKKPWAAFLVFLRLGPDRSLERAYNEHMGRPPGAGRASGRWNKWMADWAWQSRATAWDAHLDSESRRGLVLTATENARTRVRNITNVQNAAMLIVGKADLANLDSTEARKLLPVALRALEETAESLREEFGVAARPTTSRELVVTGELVGGQLTVDDFDDDELLKRIAAREQGYDDDVEGEVNGRGEFVPVAGTVSINPPSPSQGSQDSYGIR